MLEGVSRRRVVLPETGLEVALLDWGGSGPLALLHHANGFCAALWDPVASRLRRHFRVIGMDARGHGDSSRPDGGAAAFAWEAFGRDVVGVGSALVAEHGGPIALGLGHSFGGTALLMASASRPELFERLVLVDPVAPARASDAPRHERAQALVEGARRRRHVFPSREAARAAWAGKSFFAGWDPRALDLYVAEGLRDRKDGRVELKCPGEVEAAIFVSGPDFDVWPLAPRVKVPVLVLWAARHSFPRAIYEDFARRMPDARIVDVDAGHLIPMERPDLVVDHLLAFCGLREPVEQGAPSD